MIFHRIHTFAFAMATWAWLGACTSAPTNGPTCTGSSNACSCGVGAYEGLPSSELRVSTCSPSTPRICCASPASSTASYPTSGTCYCNAVACLGAPGQCACGIEDVDGGVGVGGGPVTTECQSVSGGVCCQQDEGTCYCLSTAQCQPGDAPVSVCTAQSAATFMEKPGSGSRCQYETLGSDNYAVSSCLPYAPL